MKANPLAAVLDVPLAPSGRIRVGPDLRIDGRPAFAIGDIAAIPVLGRGGDEPTSCPSSRRWPCSPAATRHARSSA